MTKCGRRLLEHGRVCGFVDVDRRSGRHRARRWKSARTNPKNKTRLWPRNKRSVDVGVQMAIYEMQEGCTGSKEELERMLAGRDVMMFV